MQILDKDIEEMSIIHFHFYDYSKVDRNLRHKKICIICPIHGEFFQDFYKHKSGQNCPKCIKMYYKGKEKIILN